MIKFYYHPSAVPHLTTRTNIRCRIVAVHRPIRACDDGALQPAGRVLRFAARCRETPTPVKRDRASRWCLT
jgi:hypothetical protein